MNIIELPLNTSAAGTEGNDLIYGTGEFVHWIKGGGGDDIVIGSNTSTFINHIEGQAGNDTLMGSRGNLDFGTYAIDGIFDHQAAFVDDNISDNLFGGEGDDLIYLGVNDYGYGDAGNDTFDVRFSNPGNTYAYGGEGTDRLLVNLNAGDTYTESGGSQSFVFGNGTTVSGASLEEIQIANASNPWADGDFVHTIGSGSKIIGLTRQISSAQGAASGDVLLEAVTLVETADPNGIGFTIVSGAATRLNTGIAVNDGVWVDFYDGLGTVSTRFGTATIVAEQGSTGTVINYTADAFDLEAEINAGTQLNLGGAVLDTAFAIYGAFQSTTYAIMPTGVYTKVELFYTLPESLDLSGVAGLTQGAIVMGNAQANAVTGTAFDDVIRGWAGNDTIDGGSGDDSLGGGAGDDSLFGGLGNDDLRGAQGSDSLYGGAGNDTLGGGGGNDLLLGDEGNDELYGQNGNDTLYGGSGRDKLFGGKGSDMLFGDDGADRLAGGEGNDFLFGGQGHDRLLGGGGNDMLFAGSGNNTLRGGAGEDTLYTGEGNDMLYGGAGADKFVFLATAAEQVSKHTIADFTLGEDILTIVSYSHVIPGPSRMDLLNSATEDLLGVHLSVYDSSILLMGTTLHDLQNSYSWYEDPNLPI